MIMILITFAGAVLLCHVQIAFSLQGKPPFAGLIPMRDFSI